MDEWISNHVDDCELNDLGYIGRWCTWERGRFLSTNIKDSLDRGVASLDWMNLFPSYQIEHLSHFFSDHCPILFNTMGTRRNDQCNRDKLFCFEAKWCLESSFEEEVFSKRSG